MKEAHWPGFATLQQDSQFLKRRPTSTIDHWQVTKMVSHSSKNYKINCDDLSGWVRDTGSYLVSNPTSPGWWRKGLKGKRLPSIITDLLGSLTKPHTVGVRWLNGDNIGWKGTRGAQWRALDLVLWGLLHYTFFLNVTLWGLLLLGVSGAANLIISILIIFISLLSFV